MPAGYRAVNAAGTRGLYVGSGDIKLLYLSYAFDDFRSSWVSLDADDSDARRFWRYVIAVLETVYPATGTSAVALLRSSQLAPMDAIITIPINASTPMARNAALMLDDDHLITTPAIHAAITFFNLAAAVHWADTSDLHVDNEHSSPRCAIGAAATGAEAGERMGSAIEIPVLLAQAGDPESHPGPRPRVR